jgi:pimeloyl-ACP methyl ester carboxylesterase
VQDGDNELDRFIVDRVVRVDDKCRPIETSGPIVLLPSAETGFGLYCIGGPGACISDFLALKGLDVFGYTPRSHGISAETRRKTNCSSMKNWGFETYTRDVELIVTMATSINQGRPVVIGGHAIGGAAAIAVANRYPSGICGLLLIDSALFHISSDLREIFGCASAAIKSALFNGMYYDNRSAAAIKEIMTIGVTDPSGPSRALPGKTNSQAMYEICSSPGLIPQAERPGQTMLAIDYEQGWAYASPKHVKEYALELDDYTPLALRRDYWECLGGSRAFLDGISRNLCNIFSMQSGRGIGVFAEPTLALMPRTKIIRHFQSGFGHADWMLHREVAATTGLPIFDWIEQWVEPVWRNFGKR